MNKACMGRVNVRGGLLQLASLTFGAIVSADEPGPEEKRWPVLAAALTSTHASCYRSKCHLNRLFLGPPPLGLSPSANPDLL